MFLNLFTRKVPFVATIKSVKQLCGATYHVVIDHEGKVPYWEGQCYGVIPPGDEKRRVRMYSISSSRAGEDLDGNTASLCVKRTGMCSSFLCDAKPGDKVPIVGPMGKRMLLREAQSHIMVATGTGVAPFRGFLRRMFLEPEGAFGGKAWLLHGVPTIQGALYSEEMRGFQEQHPESFTYDLALSRPEDGGKMYVQDKLEQNGRQVLELLDAGAHIYFCGLKEMMPGIKEAMKRVAQEQGQNWDEKLSKLKKNDQWHVDVYDHQI